MRSLAIPIVSLAASFALGAYLFADPKPAAQPTPLIKGGAADHDHLTVKSLTVRDGDGPAVSIQALNGTAGIWICDPKTPTKTVAIYFRKGEGPVIGLYDGRAEPLACSFAVSGVDGRTSLQLIDDAGKIHVLPTGDLLKRMK